MVRLYPSAPRKVGDVIALETVSGRRMLCRLLVDCPEDMWTLTGDVEPVFMVGKNDMPDKALAVRTDKIVSAHAVIGREVPA
ncbi:MAG: hypothetical protein IID51_11180 [Proteobacteria bacterium]|nr:hypothetical protein [Pseudomonadota bacterium]